MPKTSVNGKDVKVRITKATSDTDLETAKDLVLQYSRLLKVDLDFQDFEKEIEGFLGAYSPPQGVIFLAFLNEKVAGCVAMRPLGKGVCEMKRLFVKPEFRGFSIGVYLAEAIITEARKMGYDSIRLDTLPDMKAAQSLYSRLGFVDIPEYRHNPIKGARFMELRLH